MGSTKAFLRREVKKSVRKDRKAFYDGLAEQMTHADNTGYARKVHSIAKQFSSKHSGLSENIKDSQGQLVTDASERIETSAVHFEQLLNRPAPAENHMEMNTAKPFSSVETAPHSTQEIRDALDKLKANKARGIDNILHNFSKKEESHCSKSSHNW